ncbi:MAG: hypothetical protein HQL20_10815 [Candidatus Omnitrophica bacterium]|nr:hypothetical protein [Candidatus Omnitrophota bacterium]
MIINLSPYEGDRMISDTFGLTEMGRDLLAEDYLLKQLTASLIHPDTELGKKFWDELYRRANEKFGTTDVPVDTFNKVWIIPDDAVVFEKGNSAFLLTQHLKVYTERDYLAMKVNAAENGPVENMPKGQNEALAALSQGVLKDIIVPAIEQEINTGRNFAGLRQIAASMVLATWYKKALKNSILGQVYADQGKVKGIDQDPANNEQVYRQYVEAFQKGVFNLIKEDVDLYTQEVIPRKYFSGGAKRATEMLQVVDGSQNLPEAARDAAGEVNLSEYDNARTVLRSSGEMASRNASQRIAVSDVFKFDPVTGFGRLEVGLIKGADKGPSAEARLNELLAPAYWNGMTPPHLLDVLRLSILMNHLNSGDGQFRYIKNQYKQATSNVMPPPRMNIASGVDILDVDNILVRLKMMFEGGALPQVIYSFLTNGNNVINQAWLANAEEILNSDKARLYVLVEGAFYSWPNWKVFHGASTTSGAMLQEAFGLYRIQGAVEKAEVDITVNGATSKVNITRGIAHVKELNGGTMPEELLEAVDDGALKTLGAILEDRLDGRDGSFEAVLKDANLPTLQDMLVNVLNSVGQRWGVAEYLYPNPEQASVYQELVLKLKALMILRINAFRDSLQAKILTLEKSHNPFWEMASVSSADRQVVPESTSEDVARKEVLGNLLSKLRKNQSSPADWRELEQSIRKDQLMDELVVFLLKAAFLAFEQESVVKYFRSEMEKDLRQNSFLDFQTLMGVVKDTKQQDALFALLETLIEKSTLFGNDSNMNSGRNSSVLIAVSVMRAMEEGALNRSDTGRIVSDKLRRIQSVAERFDGSHLDAIFMPFLKSFLDISLGTGSQTIKALENKSVTDFLEHMSAYRGALDMNWEGYDTKIMLSSEYKNDPQRMKNDIDEAIRASDGLWLRRQGVEALKLAVVQAGTGLKGKSGEERKRAERFIQKAVGQILARLVEYSGTLGNDAPKSEVINKVNAVINALDASGAVNPATELKGGIDMAQSNLSLRIKRDGSGVPLPVSAQNMEDIRVDGLVPEILSIMPAAGIPALRESLL